MKIPTEKWKKNKKNIRYKMEIFNKNFIKKMQNNNTRALAYAPASLFIVVLLLSIFQSETFFLFEVPFSSFFFVSFIS